MMLCTHCNTYRPANDAPCPHCGGPATPGGVSLENYGASSSLLNGWGGGQVSEVSWSGPGGGQVSDVSWGAQSFVGAGKEQGNANNPSLWAQVMSPELAQQQAFPGMPEQLSPGVQQQAFPENPQPSMLPVPYQGGQDANNPQSLAMLPLNQALEGTMMPAPLQTQIPGPALPGIPTEEEAVYIPPMYTKPRPIIPRYRAISGLLSFLIVMLLLCSGAVYFAKTTGKLAVLGQLFGGAPPSIASMNAHLPDPKPNETGPASDVITSATTAPSVDPKSGVALRPSQIFKPGDTVYLAFSVHTQKPGTVTIKWYTNDNLFYSTSHLIPSNKGGSYNGLSQLHFTQQLEGKIEIYWNDGGKNGDQLAVRLYFVVR